MSVLIEVCVDSIESAVAAKQGGADRLEVCSSLATEGGTPAYGLAKRCAEHVQLPVMMMIRPHDGGFVYSDDDIEVMLEDIEAGHTLGVYGFVFGALTEQKEINVQQSERLLAAAKNRKTTFHRAFDVVPDPIKALDQIIELGFDHLLTSGQATDAELGIPVIQKMCDRARGRITIIPGAGVDETNARKIVDATGVDQLHTAAAVPGDGGQSGSHVSFGEHRHVASAEFLEAIRRSLSSTDRVK